MYQEEVPRRCSRGPQQPCSSSASPAPSPPQSSPNALHPLPRRSALEQCQCTELSLASGTLRARKGRREGGREGGKEGSSDAECSHLALMCTTSVEEKRVADLCCHSPTSSSQRVVRIRQRSGSGQPRMMRDGSNQADSTLTTALSVQGSGARRATVAQTAYSADFFYSWQEHLLVNLRAWRRRCALLCDAVAGRKGACTSSSSRPSARRTRLCVQTLTLLQWPVLTECLRCASVVADNASRFSGKEKSKALACALARSSSSPVSSLPNSRSSQI
eukprot:1117758-Rhodomonas_salina.5